MKERAGKGRNANRPSPPYDALRQSEEKFRTLAEHFPDVFASFEKHLRHFQRDERRTGDDQGTRFNFSISMPIDAELLEKTLQRLWIDRKEVLWRRTI